MAQRRLKQNFNEVQAILDAVGQKVDKIEGKGLSANDYTDQDKNKLASVEEDAQENVIEVIEADGVELPIENKTVTIPAHKQSDWSQNDSSGKDYIKNRTHWEENGVVHKLHPKFLDMDTAPTSGSTKPVMSGGVKEALDGKQDVISDLADIRHGAGLGETAYQKPSAGIPASDLAAGVIPDVSGFITRTVNDLANYYLKSETYTKEEVAALIGAIRQFHYEVYAALPATGEGNVLYLIGPTGSGSDKYEEYVYANNGWVKIGDTSIDMSGYVTIDALNQALAGYVTSAALATALTGKVGSETIHNIVELTQAEYDALQTKRGDTMYITTDTTKVYIGSRLIKENVKANEEDIDFDSSDKLQFADRVYDSSTPDGLGYVILRKNKTFAQQVTATNTVYEIRYDFDLGAASVTIPAGCVLKFNGGSVVNGTIVGAKTLINSENMCFGKDVTISGTWSNETIYTKWLDFVSSNDGTTDNSVCFKQLQGLINGTRGCKVEFEPGYYQTQIIGMEPEAYVDVDGTTYPKWAMNTYAVDGRIVLNIMEVPYVDINLNGSTIKAINITCPGWNMLRLTGVEKGYVHDGTLIGMADGFSYPAYVNYTGGVVSNYEFSSLLVQSGGFCKVNNISCKYATGDGIMVGSGLWYFRAGDVRPSGVVSANGVVYFPAGGYTIENCEVSYCGRNGITLHSSDEGSLTGCHIHHIGSDGGNGVIGTDGVKGMNPRAGIDVEFEDGQGLKPVMSWDNLYIHDCGRTSFTFSATQSRMRQFSATNCQFIRFGSPNNMNAEGTMTFSGCHFEHNGGEAGLIGAGITYTDCEFILKARSITLGAVTFVNCVFDDQIEDTGSDMVFAQSQYKSVFRGCKLTVRHNIGYLQDKTFYDCVLNLYAKTFIYACGIECYNCEFNKDPEDDTVYSYSWSPGNYAAQTRGHFWFIGCRFDRLRGTGGGTGDFSLNTGDYPVVFDGCKFGALSFYHGESRSNITIRNSQMDTLFIGKYNDGGDTVKPLVFDNCDIGGIASSATGNRPTEMTGCRVGVLSGGNYKLRMINFTRCVVTNNGARNANYPDTYVVGVESVFDFKVATATVNFDLTDCYVKGAVTEATFAGTKKGCTFETPLPVIGSSQPSGGMLPNVFYTLGELAGDTTFTLATATDNTIVNHYYWTFDTPSTAPTITWPTGLTWVGGSAPTLAASKHYERSVINGVAAYMEV